MLFHITHTHRAENCSAHRPERQENFRNVMQNAAEMGVRLHGVYTDAPGHAVFLIAESDDALALARLLEPVLEYGHYDVRPVVGAQELREALA